MVQEYKNRPVDFLVVYIEEAHPTDEWYFDSNSYKIEQPKALKERIAAAKMFADDTQVDCPVLVDGMNNEANALYGALPERLYVVCDGKVAYEGGRGPFFYNLDEMSKALDDALQQSCKENKLD